MLKIIVAVAENGIIGKGNELPFDLPADRQWFKECTFYHIVVQGHNTLNSIVKRLHKPLPDRTNIVLTRAPSQIKIDGVTAISDWDKIIELSQSQDVFVIGGASLY